MTDAEPARLRRPRLLARIASRDEGRRPRDRALRDAGRRARLGRRPRAGASPGYVVTGADPRTSSDFTIQWLFLSDPLKSDANREPPTSYGRCGTGRSFRFQWYRETDSPYDDPYTAGTKRSSVTSSVGPSEWYHRWVLLLPSARPAAAEPEPSPTDADARPGPPSRRPLSGGPTNVTGPGRPASRHPRQPRPIRPRPRARPAGRGPVRVTAASVRRLQSPRPRRRPRPHPASRRRRRPWNRRLPVPPSGAS